MARPRTIAEEDLLAAARAVFVEKGFGASTKAIASRAGVSEALLFQRYRTKADLFFAAMVPPPMRLDESMQIPAKGTDRQAALGQLGWAMLEYFRSAVPVLLPLMSHPDFDFESFAQNHPDSAMVAMRRNVVHFFIANHAPDPQAAALLLIASTQSLAMFERLGAHGGRFPDAMVQRMIDSLWRAVRPERA